MTTKKVKQLLRSHETTRLLIQDLESRHYQLLTRVRELEQAIAKELT